MYRPGVFVIAVTYKVVQPNAEGPVRYPEVATSPHWIGLMIAARKAAKLTQKQLAKKIHTSQTTVTNLERGVARTSRHVHPICEVLRIPLPYVLIADDLERRWIEAGRAIRTADDGLYRVEVISAEATAAELAGRGRSGHH